MKDYYKTIDNPSKEVQFKDRGSKFYGYTFPVIVESDVKKHINELKKLHHNARHWCYAYQLGTEKIIYRANDDGEPNNSAGMPIYGQIQSFELTYILIVVVRYFGGVKLGVSGLINAYRTCAKMALEQSHIVVKTITKSLIIKCAYEELNSVMRIIKEERLNIDSQQMYLDCIIKLSVRLKDAERIFELFDKLHKIDVNYE